MRTIDLGHWIAGVGVVALCGALPANAAAQGVPMTNWSVSVDIKSAQALSGDLNGDATGSFVGAPTDIGARTYDEVYGRFTRRQVSVGYALGLKTEVRVGFSTSRGTAHEIQIGTVGGAPLLALYDDLRSIGMDFGMRQYLAPMYSRVRPFVGSSLGFAKVRALQAVLNVPSLGSVTPNVDFYDAATVSTMAYQLGLQVRMTYRLALQAGVEARWQGNLDDLDGLAGTGLEGLNDLSAQWSLPVFVGLTWKF